jgi:hypothetical protein
MGLVFFAAGCNSGATGDSTTSDDPIPVKSWTFLVYMAGDNDLEANGWLDLNEMEQVGTTDSVNIIVQFDRAGIAPSPKGKGCGRYVISRSPHTVDPAKPWESVDSAQVEFLGNVNSGDPDTLVDFVSWGMTNYPANKYAVVLWNHGSGWRGKDKAPLYKGICYDDTSNDYITENELKYAFDKIYQSYGKKIEFVGMDACLMGMLEVAYDLKDNAKYLAASEVSISADGWPYNTILADLIDDPSFSGKELAASTVTRFKAFYEAGSTESSVAGINLAGVDDLVTALDNFSDVAVAGIDSNGKALKASFLATQSVSFPDSSGANPYVDFKDLRDFMYQTTVEHTYTNPGPPVTTETVLCSEAIRDAANEVINAQSNVTLFYWNGSSLASTCGALAIWLPDASFFYTFNQNYVLINFAKETKWYSFLGKLIVQMQSIP